ncbi:MAG: response regulator transcription factor [Flavobacteriales bacterium]|jgi:two-component system LytT family response regulator|nr:MAG: response regulator transcription factor [Flavobacteriales bacterium]
MDILLIEDEAAAVARMRKLLLEIDPSVRVVADLPTVRDAVAWIKTNPAPDLAFFDVQLADGDGFDIFRQVEVDFPVVFATAFDTYALQAFRVNAIDYLLKPLKKAELAEALQRAQKGGVVRDHAVLERTAHSGAPVHVPVKRFLIRYGDHFKLVEPARIAYIHSLQKNTFLRTREGRDLPLEESLDRLEKQLDSARFIRLNRQLIVQVDSIKELLAYSKSRVKVLLDPPYDEDAIVSSERSAAFKRWLAGE